MEALLFSTALILVHLGGHTLASTSCCTEDVPVEALTQRKPGNSTHEKECPLDKEELGRSTWGFLHTMAAYYPDEPSDKQQCNMRGFIKSFAQFYPCHICAEHFQEDIKLIPPEVKSADDLSKWLCLMHNRVNIRLGKPEFDCSRTRERWKDGWKDGSCD